MFERFTSDARAVVAAAVAEAEGRGDRHVGTEHLLLGVLASPHVVTSAALAAHGLDLLRARQALDQADADALAAIGVDIGAPEPRSPRAPATPPRRGRRRRRNRHRPLTGGAKQALEGSLREALSRRESWIGTEHVLLTLCARTEPDPAAGLLRRLGADAEALRADLEVRLTDAA